MNRFGIFLLLVGVFFLFLVGEAFSAESSDTDTTVEDSEKVVETDDKAKTSFDLEEVSVTASRKPEKVLEAPAAVSTLDGSAVRDKVASTVTDHLKAMPVVDVVTSGLTQSNVVVRGFNNIFSGSLLSLVDNRIARVPSLRSNTYSLLPTSNLDIERIEVVSGPGSALYGPNSANGVMHILTKSPFGSEGTTVTLGSGERSVLTGALRHAGSFDDRIGYKISGQYYRGNDWESEDSAEETYLKSSGKTRDFNVDRLTGEARLDFKVTDELKAILSSGFSSINQIELTGIGAGQGKGWTYSYAQGRLNYRDLFAQVFINQSDAGDTFLLRTGNPIVDKSKLFVGQVQHGLSVGNDQRFTYGLDLLLTRPDTEGTITGINEDDDNINELGVYLQSETNLPANLKFLAAARMDQHSHLDDLVFSPRAALVYTPAINHNLRATYNRAFSTPTSNTIFLDLMVQEDLGGIGKTLEPALGFNPKIDVRAQGSRDGFRFQSSDAPPKFRSPYAAMLKKEPDTYFDMHDPIMTNVMWGVGRGAVMNAFLPMVEGLVGRQLKGQGLPDALVKLQVSALSQAFQSAIPEQLGGLKNVMRTLNPTSLKFDDAVNPTDVEPIKPTITQTSELGYKGVLANRLALSVDIYQTKIRDFVGPLEIETPSVFLEQQTLIAALLKQIKAELDKPENAPLVQVAMVLDDPNLVIGQNEDGTPVAMKDLFPDNPVQKFGNGVSYDELALIFANGTAQNGASQIPFGTVTPAGVHDPNAIMLTYRNYGDISLYGADARLDFFLTENVILNGSLSFVSDDQFESDGKTIPLNAPKNKFGLGVKYINADLGLSSQLQFRYIAGFPVNSGVYIGEVDPYQLVDVNFAYDLPAFLSTPPRLSLTIQNLLNNQHQEFVGAPEIGRLALMQITQSF